MPATHHRDFLLSCYRVSYFDLHHDWQTEKDTSEPSTTTCPTATTSATAPISPQEKKKATKPLSHALDPAKTRKKDATANLLAYLINTDPKILSGCHLPF